MKQPPLFDMFIYAFMVIVGVIGVFDIARALHDPSADSDTQIGRIVAGALLVALAVGYLAPEIVRALRNRKDRQ